MPCLANVIDCLLCGTRTECKQMNEVEEVKTDKVNWPKPFCRLMSLEDESMEQKLFDSYYCVTCSCKIKSITSISTLIENMTTKLAEMRSAIEDDLYLSNPHLYGGADEDENTEPGEKNQNVLRAQMIKFLEEVKRSAAESKKCDASSLTDPVIIVEEKEYNALKKGTADGSGEGNMDQSENEPSHSSTDQNGIVDMGDCSSPSAQGSKKQRQRQLIKIRINSDSVSEDIINTLRLQSGSGSSQTRQLIIRGYREIEVPQPSKSRSKASAEGKSPICIDLDNEAGISIAQTQQQQEAVVDAPVKKRRGRPPSISTENPAKSSATSKSKSKGKSKSVQCPVCDIECENTAERRQHVEVTHKQGSSFVCPHCDSTYNTERKLFNHQKVHEKVEMAEEDELDDLEQDAEDESEVDGADEELPEDYNDDEVDEDSEPYADDDDDEDWTDMETSGQNKSRASKGRKSSLVVKQKEPRRKPRSSKSKSKSKSPQKVPLVEESPENIEVELVEMNPEEHSDFVMDPNQSSSDIPYLEPQTSGRKSNKRKSSQIPRAGEAIVVTPAAKRPKIVTDNPVIKVSSNKKVVGLPVLEPQLPQQLSFTPGLVAAANESLTSGTPPRKSGRLRPKYRQYFY